MLRYTFCGLFLVLVPTASMFAEEGDFPIAVLNVDSVFKAYAPLQERLVPLKQRVQELDKSAQLKQVEMETMQNQIRRTQPGTAEFERLQILLAKLQAEAKLFVDRERRSLQVDEAEIYDSVFKEMEAEVKKICQERKIRLVIKQNEGSGEEDPVQAVLKRMNRPIIYEAGLNITDAVIQAMKKGGKE